MRPLILLLLALCLGTIAATATADASDAPAPAAKACPCGPECPCGDDCDCGADCDCTTIPAALRPPSDPETPVASAGYIDVEAEIADLKRRMDLHADWSRKTTEWLNERAAGEEARIEAVVTRILGEVSVGIRAADGSVRSESVAVGENWQGGFDLSPGESIDWYEDPITGQKVSLGQPQQMNVGGRSVAAYQTPFAEFRTMGRRGAFRVRPTQMMDWMSRGGFSTCGPGGCN